MRIIVTGASGVVGSAVLEKAAEAGNYKVTALTRSAVPAGTAKVVMAGKAASGMAEKPAASMNGSSVNDDAGREPGNTQTDLSVTWRQTDYSYESLVQIFRDAEGFTNCAHDSFTEDNEDTDIRAAGDLGRINCADSMRRNHFNDTAVIHLAGIKAGVKGAKTELSDYDEDHQMTQNILRACEDCGIGCLVYSSSRIVYGNPDNLPWTEETVPEPRMAYGINKMRCEDLCRRYSEKTGARVWILRVAQVISEADRMRNMVNVFRDLAAEKKELTVIGKSIARRQYIYSRDLAEIILRLISIENSRCSGLAEEEHTGSEAGSISGLTEEEYTGSEAGSISALTAEEHTGLEPGNIVVVNAGMEQSYTNYEIALAFNRAFGSDTPVRYDDSAPETITPSYMDVSRMVELTGCHPADMDHALADMAHRMRNASTDMARRMQNAE